MKNIMVIGTILLLACVAQAGENDEAKAAYCKYVTEQAMAQRDLLRTPSAVVGPMQPSTGTAAQMVFGVTNSLSDDRKSSLTMKVARQTCELYSASVEAQQHLLYALPAIEKDVLHHRLMLIQKSADFLDALLVVNMKIVEAHNLTRPAVYVLENAKVRLDSTRTATLTGIASPYVPPLSPIPLKVLVAAKLQAEDDTQRASIKLTKQSGWDVKLTAGAHRQLSSVAPGTAPVGAYAEFALTYSLGRKSIDRHLDNSAIAYSEWKRTQFDDVSQQAAVLKHQIEETVVIQEGQLKVLKTHDDEISKDLASLEGLDTNAALGFKNELQASQAILRVDLGDVEFRITRLREYLATNF